MERRPYSCGLERAVRVALWPCEFSAPVGPFKEAEGSSNPTLSVAPQPAARPLSSQPMGAAHERRRAALARRKAKSKLFVPNDKLIEAKFIPCLAHPSEICFLGGSLWTGTLPGPFTPSRPHHIQRILMASSIALNIRNRLACGNCNLCLFFYQNTFFNLNPWFCQL